MSRYKLVVQYDGSEFSGWQLQKKSRTVQGVLEDAVQKITNSTDRIPVHGSGRTDAGVHAWAQVAHTDMELQLSVDRIKRALNGNLPQDCRIVGVEHTHND
ncbi:MAG TPA: tRNA pseudouridine(38-40) synthase TruA, partial [Candidatus Marinimicrobia bacterium]|nr:tRNA pseudouridine(38-40) synthase TruA [Candidatus Neomarinimicrobiota bacterium]